MFCWRSIIYPEHNPQPEPMLIVSCESRQELSSSYQGLSRFGTSCGKRKMNYNKELVLLSSSLSSRPWVVVLSIVISKTTRYNSLQIPETNDLSGYKSNAWFVVKVANNCFLQRPLWFIMVSKMRSGIELNLVWLLNNRTNIFFAQPTHAGYLSSSAGGGEWIVFDKRINLTQRY